jgi:lysine biosynthesis protein LysW
VCGELLEVVDAHVAEQIECPECGELFRVVSLQPLQLTYAYEQDEEGEYSDEDTASS